MRLAMMQPYFFPYIGYFQLLHAADMFVVADAVQYMQGGWIARNRIAGPKGWRYISVPVAARAVSARIGHVQLAAPTRWRRDLLATLASYRRAPFYDETIGCLETLLGGCDAPGIAAVNTHILRGLAHELGLSCRILVQSELGLDYAGVQAPGDWAAVTAAGLRAGTYINPVNGAAFHHALAFQRAGCALLFLRPHGLVYEQNQPFEPRLSIIDVLMAHGIAGTRPLLAQYDLLRPEDVAAA
jgi:hypothetical protein